MSPVARFDLDLIEKIVVALLLGLMAGRMLPSVIEAANYLNLLLFISEAVVVFFVVFRRRAAAISHRTFDWFLGFAGTFMPLLAMPAHGEPVIPVVYCVILMLSGLCVQLAAKLTLRRSFGLVAANRGVKITGPYRLIRHPMYAGYVLTHLGFLMFGPNLWNLGVYSVAFSLFVARILAEERMLGQDPAYQEFSGKVPYRLLPLVF
jgi:protein-S-isoprenylcysteine O-methyltransferase Ste14